MPSKPISIPSIPALFLIIPQLTLFKLSGNPISVFCSNINSFLCQISVIQFSSNGGIEWHCFYVRLWWICLSNNSNLGVCYMQCFNLWLIQITTYNMHCKWLMRYSLFFKLYVVWFERKNYFLPSFVSLLCISADPLA